MNFLSWNYSIKKMDFKKNQFKTVNSQSKEQKEKEVCIEAAM